MHFERPNGRRRPKRSASPGLLLSFWLRRAEVVPVVASVQPPWKQLIVPPSHLFWNFWWLGQSLALMQRPLPDAFLFDFPLELGFVDAAVPAFPSPPDVMNSRFFTREGRKTCWAYIVDDTHEYWPLFSQLVAHTSSVSREFCLARESLVITLPALEDKRGLGQIHL